MVDAQPVYLCGVCSFVFVAFVAMCLWCVQMAMCLCPADASLTPMSVGARDRVRSVQVSSGGALSGAQWCCLCSQRLCLSPLRRQDSLVALRALVEYSYRARLRDITEMRVNIEATASELDSTLSIDNATLMRTHRLDVSGGGERGGGLRVKPDQ